MLAPTLVWIYSALSFSLFYIISSLEPDSSTCLRYWSVLVISYCTGILASITIYRRYFHRLRSFPGPGAAALSKFWHVWQCRRGKNYLVVESLRQKYGPIIRTGPEEITIIDPSIPTILDGPGNTCDKAVWYDFLLPEVAVNTTRNKGYHDLRRRIWDRGFSPKALATYEQRIVEYGELLAARIGELSREGRPVVVTDWFYWFTFDVMGEFAFARSFSMLHDEQWHFAVRLLRRAMTLLGPFSPVPWLAQIAFHFIPWMYLIRDWFAMLRWCKQRMEERVQVSHSAVFRFHKKHAMRLIAVCNSQMKVEKPDVSQWLIDASVKQNSLQADKPWLNGDAIAIIIAGR